MLLFSGRPREQNSGFSHFSFKILIKEQEKILHNTNILFCYSLKIEQKANPLEILQITSVITGGKEFKKRRKF